MSEAAGASPAPAPGAGSPAPDAFDALLQRLSRQHVPFDVLWELTHACNLRCLMCYNVRQAEPELNTGECLDVLEQLAEAGALRLTLTGGEILARPDFFTIAGRARALGFALYLKTNGTLLTADGADRLAALAPMRVDISLLGANAGTVASVTGSPHALARALAAVRLLQQRGVRVRLNTLLLDRNLGEQAAMAELAAALGAEHEQTIKISPADDGRRRAGEYQLGRGQMTAALAASRAPFAPRDVCPDARTCKVGLALCLISPYGMVYPCIELRTPAGSLREQRFAAIWRAAPVLRELRARHVLANLPDCRACDLARYCEGRCAGLAWKEQGDPYRGHTLACQHAQARYAQQHPDLPIPATPLLPGNGS